MMAATATAPSRTVPPPRRRDVQVQQPPQVIWPNGPGGEPRDVTGLDPEAFHRAITEEDHDQWDYPRLAAETGRAVATLRKWTMNAYAVERGEEPDRSAPVFIVPDDRTSTSPWWCACRARKALMSDEIQAMTPDGRAIPYKSRGRSPGTPDRTKRRTSAPVRESSEQVRAQYRHLTGRKINPLTDRQARAELCRLLGINRRQLVYRLGPSPASGQPSPNTVDNAELRARYLEMVAEEKAAGYSDRGASGRARAALAAETGLNRRQLAARIAAAEHAAQSVVPRA